MSGSQHFNGDDKSGVDNSDKKMIPLHAVKNGRKK
jgi:hypothetical protein